MANILFRGLQKSAPLLKSSSIWSLFIRSYIINHKIISIQSKNLLQLSSVTSSWGSRNMSYGSVNLVISEGKTKFETNEVEPPKKDKWKTKKRFKLQRKREKQKRKAANKRDPRRLGVKGKKPKFANAEERIKFKLEKARIKEAMLLERLKRYEVLRVQGPVVEPHNLTGEERFYLKKMAQKKSNYVPIGRRGIFGGVILNMHMHWKKHETVKVICKPCKPGQVHEYAQEIARLSGGIPLHIIGDNTIIFYRGKDYVQPEVMSPIDTLSKKRALEKSKYEQSLESVRRFIAIAEKELELYYRHIALYGDPRDRNPLSMLEGANNVMKESGKYEKTKMNAVSSASDEHSSTYLKDADSSYEDGSGDELFSFSETDSENDITSDLDKETTDEGSCHEDDCIGDLDIEDAKLQKNDIENAESLFTTQDGASKILDLSFQVKP